MHPAVRLLRGDASSARTAMVLAEVLGKPRALRRYQPRG